MSKVNRFLLIKQKNCHNFVGQRHCRSSRGSELVEALCQQQQQQQKQRWQTIQHEKTTEETRRRASAFCNLSQSRVHTLLAQQEADG